MAIQFGCVCGKKLQAGDEHAGKRTTCPNCGQSVVIGQNLASTTPLVASAGFGSSNQAVPPLPPHAQPVPRGPFPPAFSPLSHPTPEFAMAFGTLADAPMPLTDDQINDLKTTELFRRRIRQAAIWFRVQFLAVLILTVILFAGLVVGFCTAKNKVDLDVVAILSFVLVIYLGIVCLFYFAYRTTWNCQRWAPLTMMILNLIFAALFFALCFSPDVAARDKTAIVSFGLVSAVVLALIAFICYRAWSAIPKFLAQPQWCQRALRNCGL